MALNDTCIYGLNLPDCLPGTVKRTVIIAVDGDRHFEESQLASYTHTIEVPEGTQVDYIGAVEADAQGNETIVALIPTFTPPAASWGLVQ